MGWWGRKKTVVDAEPKTDTLQIDNELVASTTKLINETYFGDASMATVTILPTETSQSGTFTLTAGTGGLTGITVGNTTYSVPCSPYNQYNYTAGQTTSQPVFPAQLGQWGQGYILPGTPVYHAGLDAYVPVNEIPSRSEFTEDEIEQAERIMEELSHA